MSLQSYIVIALIVVLIGIPSFLLAKKRMEGINMCLGIGLPKEAPISLLFAEVKNKPSDYGVWMCIPGWYSGTIDNMERYSSVSKCPKMFKVVWAALTEKKVYEVDVEFPAEMIEKITHDMDEGFVDKFGERTTYSYFKAALFPGGVVRFHLLSSGKIESLDYSFQGKFTSEYDNDFLTQVYIHPSDHNIDDFHNIYYKPFDENDPNDNTSILPEAEYVNNVGLPNKVWDRYYTRYNYKIRFSFEDPESYLYFWSPKFTNAEKFSCQSGVNDDIVIQHPATICSMNMWFQDKEYRYTSYFYFNEEEMLPLFEKAFASHPDQEGELLVRVNDTSVELSLNFGEEKYQIQKTEIRVFRDPLSNLRGESELIYKNYEGDHKNEFKGL